jgi:hypothetical protein
MYFTYFDFGIHLNAITFPLVLTLIALSGITALILKRKSAWESRGEKTFWLVAVVVSGAGALSLWPAFSSDYTYYQAVYQQQSYLIVEGKLNRPADNPTNTEAIEVATLVFRNVPRQITAAFKDHRQLSGYIQAGRNARVFYTSDYWRPSEYAILRLDISN